MNMTKITELRKKYNITQEQIAKVIGISRVNYNMKENGKRAFKQKEMLKIYQYFNKKDKRINMQDIFLA